MVILSIISYIGNRDIIYNSIYTVIPTISNQHVKNKKDLVIIRVKILYTRMQVVSTRNKYW